MVDFELEPADFDVKTERSVPPPLPEGFGKPPAEPPASDAGELDAPFSVEDVTTVDSRPAASLSPDSIPAAAIESVPAESIPAAAIESIPADSIPPTSAVAGAAVAATASGSPVSPTAAIGQPTALGDSVPADWTDSAPSVTNVDDIAASARSSRPPGRRKGKLLGAALALGAAAGGIYWALPLIAPGERAQVQGAAPDAASEVDDAAAADTASNTAADGAAADGTAADGTAALPGDASSGSDGASSAAQGAPTDPLLVKEADVKGCDALLEGFEQQMVDPVQEASLAWKDAREAIVKGTLAVAERKMCEAVQLHGESAALEGLAMLYLTERAPKRALGYLERAEAARPETMELINLRGDILSQLGDADGALAAWLRALKLEPDEAGRRRAAAREFDKQGQGHLRRGAVPQAERWFRRAAALDPTNILALNGLAEVFLQTERLPQAETMARRALEISEYNPQAHVVLGDVARQAGDLVAARGSYERALQVRSDHWSAKARLRELAKEE